MVLTHSHFFLNFIYRLAWGVLVLVQLSCSETKESGVASEGSTDYYHPSVSTAPTGTTTSLPKYVLKDLSLTEDVVLELGTSRVIIPAGAVRDSGKALLQSFAGTFVNSSTLRMVTESLVLTLTRTDNSEFGVHEIYKDIIVEQKTAPKTSPGKLVALFAENANLSTVAKTALTKKEIAGYLTEASGGVYNSSLAVRTARLGFVLAETTVGAAPIGYNPFVQPARNPSVVFGRATSPADIDLTWSADPRFNASFGVVKWADGEAEPDCTYEDQIGAVLSTTVTAATTSADYTASLSDLLDGTTYSIKVCGLTSRAKADSSGGTTATVSTPSRALAVLSGAPSDPSNTTALNISVGGTGVVAYQYALLTNTATCDSATLSGWISTSTPITDTINQVTGDTVKLCVYGKIDETNLQLVATEVNWTVDKTPPVFTSQVLLAPALDGYLSTADRLLTGSILGVLTASGHLPALTAYRIVSNATACNDQVAYTTDVPVANSSLITVDGVYKVCVRIADGAFNYTYGASTTFTVDTAIAFTSVALANNAANSYINLAESGLANNVVSAAVATGHSAAAYVVTPWATACTVALVYVGTIPRNTNAGFTTDGDYKVCVRISDAAGNTAYGSSPVIHLKKSVPASTSISLANAVSDTYLSTADHLLTTALSTVATGTHYDTLDYAVILNATACSAAGSWSATIPQADDAGITLDGSAYKVCSRFTDLAGNPPAYGNTAAFTYDNTPPVFTTLALAGGATDNYLNGTEVAAALDIHSAATGTGFASADYAIAASATTCDGALTYASALKKSDDVLLVTGSTYKVCVALADLAGNLSYGASANITVTVALPDCTGVTLANDALDLWINTAESALAHTLSDAASTNLVGPIKTYAVIGSGDTCDGLVSFGAQDAIPQSDDASLAHGQSYKVCAKVTDVALNTPAYCASAAFTVDKSAPTFTSLPLTNGAFDGVVNIAEHGVSAAVAGPLTAAGQSSTGYIIVSSATTCGVLLTYGGGIPTTDHATLASTGTYKVCVQLIDDAGNVTYDATANFDSDQTAPTFTSLALANEALGGYINLAESVSVLDSADSLVAAGQSATTYGSQTAAGACSDATFAGSVPSVSDIAALGGGSYKVCTMLTDGAGNITYGATSTVVVDVTVPAFSAVDLANGAADQYINAAEHLLATAMATSATGTGFDTIQYALVTDGSDCSLIGSWSGSIPGNNDAGFGADDDYVICVKLSDYAANPNAYGSSGVIHLKTDLPIFTSIDLANEVSDGYMSAADHTVANALASNLSASDYVSDAYKVATQATACNASLTYGAMPLGTDAGISAAGNYKVCVALTDVAGNISYGAGSLFEYDPTAPTFTSLALANDVTDTWLNATEHLTTNDLGGSLVASGHALAEYAVVTSATTCNNLVTYGAMPQSNNAAVTGAASWKLCVKLTDTAGNPTYGTGTGTFESDYAAPAFSSLNLTGVVTDGYLNATDQAASSNVVTATSASDHTDIGYAVVLSAVTCDVSLIYSATIPKSDHAGFSADGTYKICTKLTDTAGNTPAYGESSTFIRDVSVPTSAVTTTGSVTPLTTAGPTTVIAGTASDTTSGIASVSVSIQEGAGGCFSPSTNDFSEACPNWLAASGTTAWTYEVPDDALMRGLTYSVQSRATDLAVATGNIQTSFGSGTFSYAATEGTDLWNEAIVYESGSDDRPTASAVDTSGNLFVVGWHTVSDKNWMIKKFDKRGNEDTAVWDKDVGDTGADEKAYGITIDTAGNIYVVGSRHNGSDLDWWLKKFDPSGVEDLVNWDVILDGNSADDEALAVTSDSSNNIYVVGYGTNVAGATTGNDIWIRKYSSSGVLGCEQKLDGGLDSAADRALSVAVHSASGRLYVAGYQTTTGANQQMVVRRLRTNDCVVDATATGNSAGNNDQAASVRVDSSGAVYVAGRDSTTDLDWWIRKYSATLVLQAEVNGGVAGSHEAMALGIDSTNNLYVGGYKTAASQDWWLRQFDTSLTEDGANWDKVIDAAADQDQISSISIGTGTDDVGSVYVIGWGTNISTGASGTDWWIRKYAGP